tara:strand:- start:136 stop:330 length:195 start_codon:yes stop_codon:yes gene_type:complete
MGNLSDKNVLIIIVITIFFIFGLIFSVRSPERRIIESPIIWKSESIESSDLTPNINDDFNQQIL